MNCIKPFTLAGLLVFSSTAALAQTVSPPTTEQAMKPGAATPVLPPAPAAAPAGEQSEILTEAPGDLASSKLVGASVYNTENENIGEIEDLIISSNGTISSVVIGVGGFLGIGEKRVAMPFSALKAEKGDNNAMKVVVEGTKEGLKSMPAYKYAVNNS